MSPPNDRAPSKLNIGVLKKALIAEGPRKALGITSKRMVWIHLRAQKAKTHKQSCETIDRNCPRGGRNTLKRSSWQKRAQHWDLGVWLTVRVRALGLRV